MVAHAFFRSPAVKRPPFHTTIGSHVVRKPVATRVPAGKSLQSLCFPVMRDNFRVIDADSPDASVEPRCGPGLRVGDRMSEALSMAEWIEEAVAVGPDFM